MRKKYCPWFSNHLKLALSRFLIAQRGLEFVRENTQRQNVPDMSTEPHFEDFYGDVFQSESARRRRAQQRLQGPQMVAANIKTADLTRKAERLPDQEDDLCQRFDDLMKTIQCKGKGVHAIR